MATYVRKDKGLGMKLAVLDVVIATTLTVTPIPTAKKRKPIIANINALFRANVEPTEELQHSEVINKV